VPAGSGRRLDRCLARRGPRRRSLPSSAPRPRG
jgi:hypothetical protein